MESIYPKLNSFNANHLRGNVDKRPVRQVLRPERKCGNTIHIGQKRNRNTPSYFPVLYDSLHNTLLNIRFWKRYAGRMKERN